MKKLIKTYLIEVYEVSGSVKMDKAEEKEELAKIIKEKLSVTVDDVETQITNYIPDDEYNEWCRTELPKLLKEKYKQYKLEKDESTTQEEAEWS